MEDALVHRQPIRSHKHRLVLILVLMEDALVHVDSKYICCVRECLNPCFNGRCTRTDSQKMEVAAKLMS